MDAELNLRHWDAWAEAFGTDFRATTKCKTIKMLEVDALARRLSGLGVPAPRVLEVGCGNALNGGVDGTFSAEFIQRGPRNTASETFNTIFVVEKFPGGGCRFFCVSGGQCCAQRSS